jgi:DNA-binding MarR family transcriptional regulator
MDTTAQNRAMELLGQFNDDITRVIDDVFGTQWAEIEEIVALIALVTDHAVTTRRIADVSGMNRRAISRMVSGLREEGLAVTRRSESDGRIVEVVLTDRGEQRAKMLRAAVDGLFGRRRDLARELSAGSHPTDAPRTPGFSADPIDLLRRICEAGASLVSFMPGAATQGHLAARQRAALVQITTQSGVRPTDLSPSLGVSPAGAAYIVDQLCAKGFVTRRRGEVPGDQRAVILEATTEGTAAVDAVLEGIEHQREVFSHLFAEVALWREPAVDVGSAAATANRG